MKIKKRKKSKYIVRRVVAAFVGVVLIAGAAFAVSKIPAPQTAPLEIDSAAYSQIVTEVSAPVTVSLAPKEAAEAVMAYVDPSKEIEVVVPDTFPIEATLQSGYAILFDATSGKVLFAKNAEDKAFPASTTKILTAAVLLDTLPEDYQFTVGSELSLVSEGSSLAGLSKGNVLSMPQMIDALMLPSGNDASYTAAVAAGRAIAEDENLSDSEAAKVFADRMNERLAAIGARNSHFTVPDGFHDEDHYTTAADMAKMAVHAAGYPLIMEAAVKEYETVTFISGEQANWENSNKLIWDTSDCYYYYANGLKTGMTDEAGYCVVATARRFDHDLVCVVLGAPASDIRWNETMWLLDSGFAYIREH
ncbi:MAG: D-alanyl-D-alanine carboxypeptidase [Ruminococcus sp.]|jgi:D-alanyl-D-alanine carboxypeptidase (penicillin-binding protein 5/6)|nr:D-alanyl-D-alanine carboxypeptidase [Ruminococcus sp.]